jgi:nucleoside phosphorylase
LDKERSAFRKTRAALGSSKSLMGLDVCDVTIDGTLGAAVLCPRMGLVNASIITALVIERFSPEVLCMSGICAGVSSKSRIGQILIAHPCFEYQVGKYSPTGFQMEQYQATLKEELRQCLKLLGDSEDVVDTVYEGLEDGAFVASKAVVSTFVSGSALIADKTKLEEILTQHRKMGGLDMEAFGVMQAASLGSSTVKAFSAKAVVDYADEKKGNQYHEAGCTASARFCVEAISKLLYASQ